MKEKENTPSGSTPGQASERDHCPLCGEGYPPGYPGLDDWWKTLESLEAQIVQLKQALDHAERALAALPMDKPESEQKQ